MIKNIEQLKPVFQKAKGIIFDMDGTLIDLEHLNYTAYANTVLRAFGTKLSKDQYHRFFSGTKTAQGFNTYLESIEIRDFKVEDLIIDFRSEKRSNLLNNIQNVVTIRALTHELLQSFVNRNLKMALATSTIKEFTDIIVDHFDIRKFFDVVLTAEDVSAGKPDPTIYNTAAVRLGISNSELVVFEDSLNGIQAAKNANIVCIGLYDENWNDSYVEAADIVVEGFDQILVKH